MDGSLVAKTYDAIVGRAVEKGETQEFVKIIVDAQTPELLGVAIPGTGRDEAIHSILQCSANSSSHQMEPTLRSSA